MSETIAPVETAAPAEPAGEDSLRAALEGAYDQIAAEGEPSRGEDGRFTSRENPESQPETQPETPVSEPEIPAPSTLAEEDRAKWAELPRAAQELIAKREEAAAKEAETRTKETAPLQEVLDKYAPLYAARGVPAPQALAALFEAQRVLETRPVEAIMSLAQSYGVDLRQFAPSAPTTTNPNDPLHDLRQEVAALKSVIAEQRQNSEREAQSTIEANISRFASDPAHQHFPAVRSIMGALMQSGAAQDMEDAYQMAVRAHPTISRQVAEAESRKAAEAAAQDKAKAAAEAKAKAVQVRGTPPAPGFTKVPDDLRSLIGSVMDGAIH